MYQLLGPGASQALQPYAVIRSTICSSKMLATRGICTRPPASTTTQCIFAARQRPLGNIYCTRSSIQRQRSRTILWPWSHFAKSDDENQFSVYLPTMLHLDSVRFLACNQCYPRGHENKREAPRATEQLDLIATRLRTAYTPPQTSAPADP